MHKNTKRFWRCFDELPDSIQELAKKNFELLKRDSNHPSLHFKKVGKFWSARIGINYRSLALKEGSESPSNRVSLMGWCILPKIAITTRFLDNLKRIKRSHT